MSDRCDHGVVIDAITCFDCITEESESLRVENETIMRERERIGNLCGEKSKEIESLRVENKRLTKLIGYLHRRVYEEQALTAAAQGAEAILEAMHRYIGSIPPKLLTPGLKRMLLAINHRTETIKGAKAPEEKKNERTHAND